jgi:transposase
MSRRELERVEVMGRVASKDLGVKDAAAILGLSYRQAKRVWRRYRERGAEGLKHANAGRESNRGKPRKLRRRVLSLIRRKYSGTEGEGFGPTLAAEHLGEEDGIAIDHETCAAGCWKPGYGVGDGSGRSIVSGASASRTLANWCSWTEVFMTGWKSAVRAAV